MPRTAPPPQRERPVISIPGRGRPRFYKTAEDFRQAVEEYFESCWDTIYEKKSNEGGEYLEERKIQNCPYTITGLAVHLGMTREALLYYKEDIDPDFFSIVKQAKQICQMYAEEQTYRANGQVTGPIFNLKVNYGWVETTRKEITGPGGVPLMSDRDQSDERAKQTREMMIAELGED